MTLLICVVALLALSAGLMANDWRMATSRACLRLAKLFLSIGERLGGMPASDPVEHFEREPS